MSWRCPPVTDWILPLERISDEERPFCGGKAGNLGIMARSGIRVPPGICLTTAVYDAYIDETPLRGRIYREVGRKDLAGMRWEEMWDASLRIRNLFAITPLPPRIHDALAGVIEERFTGKSVVVRSSSVAEDSAGASFAGVHESFVHITGTEAILDHVRLVWSSLWSDAALLYRQELGLSVRSSAMAVVIQEIVEGDVSGIIFGMNPQNEHEAVIEAVYGLNQALVDGSVEPDRWILDRDSGRILSHHPARREAALVTTPGGVVMQQLEPARANAPPLSGGGIRQLHRLVTGAEALFGAPQDMEWTRKGADITVLQSRPVTAAAEGPQDERQWYLGLKGSFTRLKRLQKEIEEHWLPDMLAAGRELAAVNTGTMTDAELGAEILRQVGIAGTWHDIYWEYFIPFAHGVRLFGIVYNDTMHPDDPYEFVDLLAKTRLLSVERNRELAGLAAAVRRSPDVLRGLAGHDPGEPLTGRLEEFVSRYGSGIGEGDETWEGLVTLIREMAAGGEPENQRERESRAIVLRETFLSRFQEGERAYAEELLALARRSYELRDNDNHALDAVEAELRRAAAEGKRRLRRRGVSADEDVPPAEIAKALLDPAFFPRPAAMKTMPRGEPGVRARQLVGQPASRGSACGSARVIRERSDLFTTRAGEILVCDAIEPGMTFVVPICAGVIERRGGMLIHGAIIAREYGIPCVTGIPRATEQILTGDEVCVDGYLGIVTIRRRDEERGGDEDQGENLRDHES
jgi:phosphohistidine swiveling domain-containing protein